MRLKGEVPEAGLDSVLLMLLLAGHVLCAGEGRGAGASAHLVHMLHDMIVWLVCLFKSKPKICNCEVQERLQASLPPTHP